MPSYRVQFKQPPQSTQADARKRQNKRKTKEEKRKYSDGLKLALAYNNASRKTTETLPLDRSDNPSGILISFTTTSEDDTDNQLIKITYPDGSVMDHSHTARHQLVQIKWNNTVVHDCIYHDGGRLASTAFGNGVTSTFGYRSDNLLTSINTPAASGATQAVGNYGYGWDANKNKTSETISGPLANYGFGASNSTVYDDENRLTTWKRNDGLLDRSWDLSLVGDWDSLTVNGVVESRTHEAAHEIVTVGSDSLTHDAKGNLTSYGAQPTPTSLTWDFDNKLVSATIPAGAPGIEGTHTYTYDALGRRVSKHIAPLASSGGEGGTGGGAGVTTTTLFVCTEQQVILEYEVPTAGSPTVAAPDRKFVYGSYVDEPILLSRVSTVTPGTYLDFYYSRNQQYSITALTDSAGEVIERYAYDPYGQVTIFDANGSEISNSAYQNPYTYTARRSDPETGLLYFHARMYSPTLGRFISRDPLGFVDGMSLYRAYFVPGGIDLEGTIATLPQKPTKAEGAASLARLARAMQQRCDACCKPCKDENCDVKPGECCAAMCKTDAAKIAQHIIATWNHNFGRGQGKQNNIHSIGGYMCWDWLKGFGESATKAGAGCWGVERQFRFEHPGVLQPNGQTKFTVHHYIVLTACGNADDKCKVVVDDGFYVPKKLVHDWPFLPNPPWKTPRETIGVDWLDPPGRYTLPPIEAK